MPETTEAPAPRDFGGTLKHYLGDLIDPKHENLLAMLTEDAVMVFPYALPDSPRQLNGKAEITKFFIAFRQFMTISEITHVATHRTTNPDVAILEFEGKGESVQTGLPYEQKYISVLTLRDGQICHWKDYWNPMNVLAASGGVGPRAELPADESTASK